MPGQTLDRVGILYRTVRYQCIKAAVEEAAQSFTEE